MKPADRERWDAVLADPAVQARYWDKVVQIPGSDCLWWVGAISGRGHGRFWVAAHFAVIAHRFGYGLRYGADALESARVLGHRCDNPLCQRIGEEHIVVSTPRENRLEWVSRRFSRDSPLSDPRGPRARAERLRQLARTDPFGVRAEIERVRAELPEQLCLW